jgi:hypothetical protein
VPEAKCRKPGCDQPPAPRIGPGRPPVYCETHRPPSRSLDGDAELARRASRVRATTRIAQAEAIGLTARQSLRLASVLRLAGGDPTEACQLAGVLAGTPEEAAALVARARARHPGLCEGDPAALDLLLQAGIVALSLEAVLIPESIPPGQHPGALRQLAQAREQLGLTMAPRFASIVLRIGDETIGGPA